MASRAYPNTEFLRVLFAGKSGSGKTRTAYSATLDPRASPVLGLDMSGQPVSIRDYRPEPDIIRMESLRDLTDAYRWLKRGQPDDAYAKRFELHPPYKTVVPDGWSEAQRWIVLEASGNANTELGDRPIAVEIQHYNTILAQSLAVFEGFYKLPMHVVGTVLENDKTDDRTKRTSYRHQLVGQARDQLSSYATIVGRLLHVGKISPNMQEAIKDEITSDTSHVCIFKPSLYAESKDQSGALGDIMVDPSITKILDLLEEYSKDASN
jgi:hypothetical protein